MASFKITDAYLLYLTYCMYIYIYIYIYIYLLESCNYYNNLIGVYRLNLNFDTRDLTDCFVV